MNDYRVTRFYEDTKRIIYKRLFALNNGDKRYFEFDKEAEQTTEKQFLSKTQVMKFLKEN